MDKHDQRSKILIIDDDHDCTASLKNILERRGYFVLTAQDGAEGLDLLKDNNINIIFCDILMPRMDGITFLEKLRDHNLKAEVIMVTGSCSVEYCVESLERNAFEYLTKPVSVDNVLKSLHKAEKRIKDKMLMLRSAAAKQSELRKQHQN